MANDQDDMSTGGYVHHTSYKLMRLRMLLTGTNAPTEEDLSEGLTRLLNHLEKHPVPPKEETP